MVPELRVKANQSIAFMMRCVRSKLNELILTAMSSVEERVDRKIGKCDISFIEEKFFEERTVEFIFISIRYHGRFSGNNRGTPTFEYGNDWNAAAINVE